MYTDILGDIESDIDRDWSEIVSEREDYKIRSHFSNIFHLLDELVDINIANRANKDFLPLTNYILNYCTIRFNIGRQIGITTYIKNRATKEDIIIVPHQKMIDYGYRDILDKIHVTTVQRVKQAIPMYASSDYVNLYFDNTTYIPKEDLDEMMGYIFPRNDIEQTFFLLG